jgi:hypothetical protein
MEGSERFMCSHVAGHLLSLIVQRPMNYELRTSRRGDGATTPKYYTLLQGFIVFTSCCKFDRF